MKSLVSLLAIVSICFLTCDRLAHAQDEAEQKAVLVTGASSGIGLRIAETLAEKGFYVYAGARKAADLERLDAIENMSSVRLDVTVQKDIDAAVEFVRGEGRGLWGVVNNAGVISLSSLVNVDIADVQFTFDVNVFGPIRVNRAFLPMIIESQGRTTIIGSINGFIASAEDGGYTASKFAVEGYTDSLADELTDSGVHVSIVDPGAYKSEIRVKMLAQQLAAADAGEIVLDDKARAEMIRTNFGNSALQEPDDVASAVVHAMSSDSPKRRYMVVPNADQANMTIRAALQRLLEINEGQPYSYDRDQLVALLDELLEK
jgi:NAD(P)-dependent dehydrogenase (short-subunit alcohol dehydrogenase family)